MPATRLTIEDLMEILVTKAGLPREGAAAGPFATFGDVGLDSLAYLQLQAAVADGYGLELDDDMLHATFGEIVALVNASLADHEGLPQ